ncbi:hypothetical protein SAPIO_CDS3069 [Scedosporium apiospermum]|uniref:BZIP-type transcription factor n=1 Tax=Pseudallescheria apiosperma TaxID=563466 RepID=A0A084G9Y4_PSEDA|nr:uncharacterized protein SAPIO_CDS3069 [Scedosporium apiospermum]KEZ44146.1 hypothetical protein SAPIO_CDS3069 [Scedosporium apiospermum]
MSDPGAAYPSPPTTAEPFKLRNAPAGSNRKNHPPATLSMSSELYTGRDPVQGSSQGSAMDQGDDKGSSSLNLGFLKTLTERRKNRGITHRERKELYIKALEDEVLRLKEIFSNVSNDKQKLSEENKQLKTVLAQNGINVGSSDDAPPRSASVGYTSSPSASGHSYAHGSHSAFTPPLTSQSSAPSISPSTQVPPHSHRNPSPNPIMAGNQLRNLTAQQLQANRGVDYEQAGIDFVLTLEKPCMHHLPWLLERSADAGGEPCGHALMASCPPEPFPELTPDIPFGYTHVNGDLSSGQRTWELSKGDLATLLDLSKRLNLDGEITPVMAWGMVLGHPRLNELKPDDFVKLAEELKTKVRCYGFGAVMEEFEVRDALECVFSTKPEIMSF